MKIKKAFSALIDGTRDYETERKKLSAQAERTTGHGSGSFDVDLHNHAKELDRLMREQHLSWGGSIKKRYNSN